ncbi:nucleoside deaminase [Guptibacillus algicola]|uniref:nucleoside deaminase n=1 Tax=Guptibacillus algicola TaxID=225844 RepID=UPI001CD58C26|nr:nucleoside deaminase [Alkalihalobacillus algicola]MCA0988954.1 nucleoside deaminase [Alkalihalobacillus algicola]
MTHEDWLNEAIKLATTSVMSNQGGPFGAIVVKDGRIVGQGNNQVTSTNDPTAHAEVVAIRDACTNIGAHQLTGCTIYSSCEPCPMCLGAIYWSRPQNVYFAATRLEAAESGFDDALIYNEIEKPPHERLIPFHHIDLADSKKPFEIWGSHSGRIDY